MKVRFHCHYCGHRWEENVWNESLIKNTRCATCKETKLIKAQRADSETYDVFGYRFSPDFPEKRDPYTSNSWRDYRD